MSQPAVKFDRIVKAGMTGDDIIALKIITSRAGCWPWQEFDAIAHPEFMNGKGKSKGTSGIKGLQRLLGVKADGVYGKATHTKTLPYRVPKGRPHTGEYVWDGYSQALYEKAYPDARRRGIVADVFSWWEWMVAHEPQIGYSQRRAMKELALHREPPRLPFDEDCSSTFIYCAFLGGAKSPDIAYGFSGYGNTDSLIRCGIPINRDQINEYAATHYVGVFYGESVYSTHHVAAFKTEQAGYSMGRQSAPERYHGIADGPGHVAGIRAYEVL